METTFWWSYFNLHVTYLLVPGHTMSHYFLLRLDDRSVRDSERRAAIMHFTSDQVLILTYLIFLRDCCNLYSALLL